MTDETKDLTVELDETPETEGNVLPTEEEAIQNEGLSPQEMEMAKKHNLLKKKEPEKKEEKEQKKEEKPDEKKETEKEKEPEKGKEKVDLRKKLNDPSYDFSVSEEEEYNSIKDFNANEKAMYFARKKERRKRQEAERLRDETRSKQELYEKELRVLRSDLDNLKNNKPPAQKTNEDSELEELLNEDGTKNEQQPKEDEKKYLTQEDLDGRDKEQEVKRQSQIEQAKKLNERLKEQELEVKAFHEDYNETTNLAKEIMEKPQEFFKDNPRMIARIGAMVKQMYATAGRALSEDQDYTAADIFYEIGKLHPKYGEKPPQTANSEANNADEKKNDKGSAIDRMLANSQKKGSSASVSGGGGARNISVNDITLEQAAKLSDKEYAKLPASVRERLLRA